MTSKLVSFVRHGQAEHNVADDWKLADPSLTDKGKQQARDLATVYPRLANDAQLYLSSPLKRTLQTTLLGFPAIKHQDVIVMPELQETGDIPCDTGSARAELEKINEFASFNFELLEPDWCSKQGKWAADPASLDTRAKFVRQWIRQRKEDHIVVICHAGFLRRVAQYPPTEVWDNAEARTFRFYKDDDEDAVLVRLDRPEERIVHVGQR